MNRTSFDQLLYIICYHFSVLCHVFFYIKFHKCYIERGLHDSGYVLNQNTFLDFIPLMVFFWSALNLVVPWMVYLLLDDLQCCYSQTSLFQRPCHFSSFFLQSFAIPCFFCIAGSTLLCSHVNNCKIIYYTPF